MKCIIHEIAPNSPRVEEATVIVGGCSLCIECAQAVVVELDKRAINGILHQARGGRWEFTDE